MVEERGNWEVGSDCRGVEGVGEKVVEVVGDGGVGQGGQDGGWGRD